MSLLRTALRLDHLSAALRHVRDAEHLAGPDEPAHSLDQAYHLAGFGPECARKAILSEATFDLAIGHGIGEATEPGLKAALALDPGAHRYRISGWEKRFPALAKWTEQARYEKTGSRKGSEVKAVVEEARRVVDDVVLALWMDGRIPKDFTW